MTLEATPANVATAKIVDNGIIRITRPAEVENSQPALKTRTILLTGATGALGQELLWQFLENRPVHEKVVVLARSKRAAKVKGEGDGQTGMSGAQRRVKAMLGQHFDATQLEALAARIQVVDGDVTEPRLGLDANTYEQLAAEVDSVLHCAAAVRFDQPLAEARQINLEGTLQALQLAKQAYKNGREGRFDYVSTAYVAGKRRGLITEDELEHKKGFRNTYEQTKYEAELQVRQAGTEIPVTILRPSIIIGNSGTGATTSFKAFYWPVRVYASGQMRLLPGVASCRIDLVPVDFVAAATLHLTSLPETVGGCFHLTAGHDNLVTLREIMEATTQFFGLKTPPLINPALLKLLEGKVGRRVLGEHVHKTLMLGTPYYPYLALNLEFDNSRTQHYLSQAGIAVPSIRDFFNRLFQYCVESNWGRKS